MQNKKQYRLKKDSIGLMGVIPAGLIVQQRVGSSIYHSVPTGYNFHDYVVENNPEWFEEILPVSNEGVGRIEVTKFWSSAMSDHGHWYTFHVAGTGNKFMYDIPEDKFPAIKRAIEYVLNDDSAVKSFSLSQADVEIFKTSTGLRYTQQEMDAARIEGMKQAFWAAREPSENHSGTVRFNDGDGMYYYHRKFTTFDDYLSTLSMSKEPVSDKKTEPEFVIGVDPIRGNFEWEDDAQTQVIFKKCDKGEWIAMYRKDEPYSQEKFEADMKKAAEYFSKVPLLCEECGEIGKHKETCSQSAPADKAEGEKRDWEIVLIKSKSSGIRYKYDPSFEMINYDIHSVRRKSDGEVFAVGDKIEVYYGGAKSMLNGLRQITGFKIMEGMVVLHSSGDSALNEIQKTSPSSAPEQEPLFSLSEIKSCCHDDSAGGGCLYLSMDKLEELAKSKQQ